MLPSDVQPQQLRIDDLAYSSGVPSRTIRFYNTQGLLPPPLMRGRVAYYNQEHVVILGIIRDLKEQQNVPLPVIKHLLELRAQHGEVQMNLALKQRLQRTLNAGSQQKRLSKEELAQQSSVPLAQIEELTRQGLLFPIKVESETEENQDIEQHETVTREVKERITEEISGAGTAQSIEEYSGDDLLLVELYQRLEQLGLPIALPALIRFQMRQLVRSEIAAYEQHLLPRWREAGLPLEEQTAQFEQMLTLMDTLLSIMHRKLLYQG